jgi:methyl-accepting chemotaxis protein
VAWGVIAYILIAFLLLGGLNTFIFELWVGRTLEKAVRVIVAAPGTQPQLTSAEATKSLVILLEFPFRFCLRFVIHWLIVAPIMVFLQRLFYGYPWTTLLNLALGAFLILSLMSLFHYFVIKALYQPYLTQALKNFPALIHQHELARRRVSYRGKVFLYMLVLVATMTWLASQIALVIQQEATELDRGRLFQHQVDLLGDTLLKERTAPSSPDALLTLLDRLRLDPQHSIYLMDREARNLLGSNLTELHKRILYRLPEINAGAREEDPRWYHLHFNRILLLQLGPQVIRALADGNDYTLTLASLDQGRMLLINLSPQKLRFGELKGKIFSILGIFGAGLFLAGIFAWFMSRELLSPLHGVIASMGQVAEGNLRDREPILSDDETGELAVHHYRMVDSLRQMIERIGRASSSIEAASARIGKRTLEMAEGSSAQAASVEETSAGMTEMNSTIRAIAESVETLAGTAQESSASILEMSATIEQVAQSAEQLFHTVEEVSTSLTEMTASIREVAANVRDASERAAEAAGSGREIREAIRAAEAETNRTAALSEQVTADAEQGAAAVQSTISGIERIRSASNEAAAVITGLSRRARDIGNILTVIEDVTEETGLLALNAAIIAAQAGEHGRGFAVVADEIKDLAERTQASAAEIAEQIRAVQSEAQKASAAVLQGAESVEAEIGRAHV